MTESGTPIGQVATIVSPVIYQDAAHAFYTEVLWMDN
jgi:hypothetical protein